MVKIAVKFTPFGDTCQLPSGETVSTAAARAAGYTIRLATRPAPAETFAHAETERRRREYAPLLDATKPAAPENDQALLEAVRAAANGSSRFAHLAAPLMRYEAEMRTSEVLAAIRRADGVDLRAPEGTAGFVLAAAEKCEAGTDATAQMPDANSTNRAEATAAFVLDAFRRGHEKQKR